MPNLILIISAVAFVAVGVLAFALMQLLTGRKSVVAERLEEISRPRAAVGTEAVLDTSKRETPKLYRALGSVSETLPLSPETQGKYRKMLVQAGYRSPSALGVFFGSKVVLATGLFLALSFYVASVNDNPRMALAAGIMGIVAGLIIPNAVVNQKVRNRQLAIFHALPDVLDLMTVCVEAGLGLDAAIIKICEEKQFSEQILTKEFKQVSQEVRAGKMRAAALKDMSERTGVDDIKALVALLIQTEKLGASLSRSLRVHSDSLRTKRRQLAEEAAAKTSIKLVFPLAFFVFPALLVVLLGPAVLRIFESLSGHVLK